MPRNKGTSAEEYFALTFIRKERRDRILMELTKPKRRYKGLDRFCHQSGDLVDPGKILMQGEDLERREDFASFVKKHDETCALLSPEPAVDGLELPFDEAVRIAVMCPDAVIIVGSTFAVVYGESYRQREKFLLAEK